MKIAFYAPLKSPLHPTPSGDRRLARLLMQALSLTGYDVHLASELRLRATSETQKDIYDQAMAEADRLLHAYYTKPETKPLVWFTYHHYYKAVDWLGDRVARELNIPYILAEASHAPKRLESEWRFNHEGSENIIRHAAKIFCVNKADKECLRLLIPENRLIDLPPFIDINAFAPKLGDKQILRRDIAKSFSLDPTRPWIIAVGMMRKGDKLASYRLLGEAMRLPFLKVLFPQLIIVGDGEAKTEIHNFLADLDPIYMGTIPSENLPDLLQAADLMAWPAINEAFCMAILEAQVCGLPVIAGDFGGVSTIIQHNVTGLIAQPHHILDFAQKIEALIIDPQRRQEMSAQARLKSLRYHDIGRASQILKKGIETITQPEFK